MCSSHLPLLCLCQCCHRDEGKQSKGMSVNQKPISCVCSLNRSAGEARCTRQHSKQSSRYEMTLIHLTCRCPNVMPDLTHILYRCSCGLNAACCHKNHERITSSNTDPDPPSGKRFTGRIAEYWKWINLQHGVSCTHSALRNVLCLFFPEVLKYTLILETHFLIQHFVLQDGKGWPDGEIRKRLLAF